MNDSKNISDASQDDFLKWFNELEGYSLRSERFFDEVRGFMNDNNDFFSMAKELEKWLRAAFEEGVRQQKVLDKIDGFS